MVQKTQRCKVCVGLAVLGWLDFAADFRRSLFFATPGWCVEAWSYPYQAEGMVRVCR
jgi:hypothetical protein